MFSYSTTNVIVVTADVLIFEDCGDVAFISYIKSKDTSFYTTF